MNEPLLLALDTSTRTASVALARPGELLGEYTWRAGLNHTRQLLPVVRAILVENQTEMADLTAIAVAKGPGSFNGLRAGMATAKGFAYSLDIPLLAVGTLEVEAYAHAAVPWPICALHDAGRGELAWAMYRRQPSGDWVQVLTERITKPEVMIRTVRGRRTLLCGEVPSWLLPLLQAPSASRCVLASPAASVRRAALLAELAWKRLEAGQAENVATLQPLYLRRPPVGD